ncbi:hypothetical protein ACOBQJ_01285 [Pelotomaculum propionicicum]|uniref:hypothetical protein n=1 Tax=Pelotomaculum propionicicum TaxID=258475 RepID=UPI003B7894FF
MFRRVYFNPYRQALERYLSSRQEALEDKRDCLKDSTMKREQKQQCHKEVQSGNLPGKAAENSAGKDVIGGFKEIAPGIYQFRQPAPASKGYEVPPKLYPSCQSGHLNPQRAGELGFKRVDGLPGPYQHYNTPVFQFT